MTLALRTRLTVFYTLVFGVLLTAIAAVSYRALGQQLDSDATLGLIELTNGLHGYVHFQKGVPEIQYDTTDPQEAAFVQRATRFYQIYDGTTGKLLLQSETLEPLGLTFTPIEVKSFHDEPRLHDILTDYGRIRFTNSVITNAPGETYLLQVGTSLAGMDAPICRAAPAASADGGKASSGGTDAASGPAAAVCAGGGSASGGAATIIAGGDTGGDDTGVAIAVVAGRAQGAGKAPERWARIPIAATTAMPAMAPNVRARRTGRAHRMISLAPSRHAITRASVRRGGRVLGATSRTAPFTWTGVTSSARAENARASARSLTRLITRGIPRVAPYISTSAARVKGRAPTSPATRSRCST